LDSGGLAGMLNSALGGSAAKKPEMGLIGQFLDQDGDGNVMDDVAGMGMNILGRFLKG